MLSYSNKKIGLYLLCLLIIGCSKAQKETDKSLSPVEIKPANTRYEPAFSGQTRINGVKTNTVYKVTVITNTLSAPWGVVSMPNGKLLITEKGGRMKTVSTDGNVSAAITGIPAVNSSGQGGLLGLCLDPSFINNRMYIGYFQNL